MPALPMAPPAPWVAEATVRHFSLVPSRILQAGKWTKRCWVCSASACLPWAA